MLAESKPQLQQQQWWQYRLDQFQTAINQNPSEALRQFSTKCCRNVSACEIITTTLLLEAYIDQHLGSLHFLKVIPANMLPDRLKDFLISSFVFVASLKSHTHFHILVLTTQYIYLKHPFKLSLMPQSIIISLTKVYFYSANLLFFLCVLLTSLSHSNLLILIHLTGCPLTLTCVSLHHIVSLLCAVFHTCINIVPEIVQLGASEPWV